MQGLLLSEVALRWCKTGASSLFGRSRCCANSAHIRQSRPDSGLGFQVEVFDVFQVVRSSLGSGVRRVSGTQPPESISEKHAPFVGFGFWVLGSRFSVLGFEFRFSGLGF